MKHLLHFVFLFFLIPAYQGYGQLQKVTLYYGTDTTSKENVKAVFYVKENNPSEIHGTYTSFYASGQIKSVGQYENGAPTGEWNYYYEDGSIKMRGEIARSDSTYWYYYYEDGSLKQEGAVVNHNREGAWVFYYENGELKKKGSFSKGLKDKNWKYYYEGGILMGNANYDKGTGRYTEFYPEGGKKMEGEIHRNVSEGIWVYYNKDGTVQAKGYESNGVKNGFWTYYYSNGKEASKGKYKDGKQEGEWVYFHENGVLSSKGSHRYGFKDGKWQSFSTEGILVGEGNYINGTGEYKEYYESGNLKVTGKVKDDKNDGLWKYYYENGTLEGEADFVDGEGEYKGYYENGSLKMKGYIKDGRKVGVWELYDPNGEITGYYKTQYNEGNAPIFNNDSTVVLELDSALTDTANTIVEEDSKGKKKKDYEYAVLPNYKYKAKKKSKIRNFNAKPNEYKNFILSINPLAIVDNSLPVYLEYYIQERLGYELSYMLLRTPFFLNHSKVDEGILVEDGFRLGFQQRLYRKNREYGMLFGAWDLRYGNREVKATPDPNEAVVTDDPDLAMRMHEFEFSLLIGDRIVKNVKEHGPTFDIFLGLGVGYRTFGQNFEDNTYTDRLFKPVKKTSLYMPLRFGFSFGYLF